MIITPKARCKSSANKILLEEHMDGGSVTFAKRYEAEDGEVGRARAIADFIAGMTDRYTMREYGQLFDLSGLR